MRYKVFTMQVFPGKLVIIDCNDPKKLLRFKFNPEIQSDIEREEIFASAIGGYYGNIKAFYMLIDTKHEEYEYGLIVHEAVHIANQIFRYIDYKPERDNDEVEAALVRWIFEKAHKFLTTKNK